MMLTGVLLAPNVHAQGTSTPSDSTPAKAAAETRKLNAEAAKLDAEASKAQRDNSALWRLFALFGPLLTALVAAAGVVVTLRKAVTDRQDARAKEEREREDARRTAEVERFDERFASATKGLATSNDAEKRAAAVLILGMVLEKREELSDQALQLLLASLQVCHDEVCERLLKRALERFARVAPTRLIGDPNGPATVQLTYLHLSRINLAHAELPGIDLAFSKLTRADLRGADLSESKAYKTDLGRGLLDDAILDRIAWVKVEASEASFRRATLRYARLRAASLGRANFFRADLTRADLQQADLVGARFEKATLHKADFREAAFDETALRTILKSKGWDEASFDPETRDELDRLGAEPEQTAA